MSGWEPIFRRAALQTNIAPELLVRGWKLYDYRAPTYIEAAFLSWACRWTGVAIYPEWPEITLCVCVLSTDARRSTDSTKPGLIDDRRQVLTTVQPTFQPTATFDGWHIERNGVIAVSGVFPPECEVDMWLAQPAIATVVDQIETAAFGVRTIRPDSAPISARYARRVIAPLLRGHYRLKRVKASHDQWFIAWIRLPEMPQRQRQAAAQTAAELIQSDSRIGAAFGLLARGSGDGLIAFSLGAS